MTAADIARLDVLCAARARTHSPSDALAYANASLLTAPPPVEIPDGWEWHIARQIELNRLWREAAAFNARCPLGTPVLAYPGIRPEDGVDCEVLATRTRSRATVLSGHTAVVWVDGHGACIALSHIDIKHQPKGAS